MTDLIYTDDQLLEQSAADVRVFGKWSGAEIQISDMSLEVRRVESKRFPSALDFVLPGLHSRRETTEISAPFCRSLSSETLPQSFLSDRRTSRLLVDVPRT